MLTMQGYREKEAIKVILADLAVTCLWNPEICEAHGRTEEHEITAYRDAEGVKVIIKKRMAN